MARRNEGNKIPEETKPEETKPEETKPERYKTMKCNVLAFNKKTKELDVNYNGYGIRINNVDNVDSGTVEIKYKGEIGKPGFTYKI